MAAPESFLHASPLDSHKQGPPRAPASGNSNSTDVVAEFTTCADRASTFFRILTAPFPSSQPSEPSQALSPDLCSSDDTQVHLPWSEQETAFTPPSGHEPSVDPVLPRGYWPSVLSKRIFSPHGKWSWADGKSFEDVTQEALLRAGGNHTFSMYINSGSLDGRRIQYLCKSWPTQCEDFLTELALYKCQLKPLQGSIVPSIIGVHTSVNRINVSMEAPHPVFWIEASPDMPHVLKRRCVEAFQTLHDQGVLHGNPELRHMLIGGDARVTIVGFQRSKAMLPNETLKLAKAAFDDFQQEMKGVKRRLRYDALLHAEDAPDEEMSNNGEGCPCPPTEAVGPEPRRFVMPGQTPAQLDDAIRGFLHIVDDLIKAESSLNGPSHPYPPISGAESGGTIHSRTTGIEANSPYFLRHRSPQSTGKINSGHRVHKRKDPSTHGSSATSPPKRPRRGEYAKSAQSTNGRMTTTRVIRPIDYSGPTLQTHSTVPHLIIPEHLPSLHPLTPSPATPSQDPLLLTPNPHSPESAASSSQPPPTSPGSLGTSSPISPRPWSDDPYGRSRAHDNYAQLVALAVKRGVPRFRPTRASNIVLRPSLSQARREGTGDGDDDDELLSSNSLGKRKRDDDMQPVRALSQDTRQREPKVLKWSDGAVAHNLAPTNPPLRIRSILKKHNPPAIRSYEMSRIAELSDGDEDLLAAHGVITVDEVDRVNDGSKDLDEELDDDLDMMIDVQDSDDNFLSGYPNPSGTFPTGTSTSPGVDNSTNDNDNLPSQASAAMSGQSPPIAAISNLDEPSEPSPTAAAPDDADGSKRAPETVASVRTENWLAEGRAASEPITRSPPTSSCSVSPPLSASGPPQFTRSLKGLLGSLFRFHD